MKKLNIKFSLKSPIFQDGVVRRSLSILLVVFQIVGCSPYIKIHKDNAEYELGSIPKDDSKKITNPLCKDGDLRKILNTVEISQEDRDSIFIFSCENIDADKLKQVLKKMSDAQLKQLYRAFKEKGYDVEEPYKFDLAKPENAVIFWVAVAAILIAIILLIGGNSNNSGGGPM
jgi:hypothetical protein